MWFLFLLGIGFSQNVLAQSSSGGQKFEATMEAGYAALATSASQIDFGPGINYVLFTNIEVGGEFLYEKIGYKGGSTSSTTILLGPTFSIGPNIQDAIFLQGGFVLRSGSTDDPQAGATNPDGAGFYFFAGKRFTFLGQFTYCPSLGTITAGTTAFVLRPLAISYFF